MDVIRPRIDERAYLGTDKSVPYKKPCKSCNLVNCCLNSASCVCRGVLVGDGFIRPEITSLCVNGRYPSSN
ncbi:MAG: hypothetical protein FWG87_05545 [Defluviitaleaceae bacterium]|nr:hypothetical protein [Defluviitaleaceae bacterium]